MDGNRRWAKEQNLLPWEGHQQGNEVFMQSIEWVRDAGIPHAVYYAFSTENWKRSSEEVGYLLELFRQWLVTFKEQVEKNNVRIRIVGRWADFDAALQVQMSTLEEWSREHTDGRTTIWLALSYGGRAEIVTAVNEAVERGEKVTEESFERLLWTAEMPDPDVIVRTSGEQRLSNFVTWKSVYSELFFLDKHWPALTKADFDGILMQYESRERRKGA